jgi:hypothetical protein
MRLCFFIVVSIFIFSSCSTETKDDIKTIKVKTPQDLDKEIIYLIPEFLKHDSILSLDSINLSCYKFFKPLYSSNLLWFEKSNINSKGDSLLTLIEKSLYYGLIPQQYHLA